MRIGEHLGAGGGREGEEVDDAKHPNQLSLAHLLDIWA
jgi:hypothetical protein